MRQITYISDRKHPLKIVIDYGFDEIQLVQTHDTDTITIWYNGSKSIPGRSLFVHTYHPYDQHVEELTSAYKTWNNSAYPILLHLLLIIGGSIAAGMLIPEGVGRGSSSSTGGGNWSFSSSESTSESSWWDPATPEPTTEEHWDSPRFGSTSREDGDSSDLAFGAIGAIAAGIAFIHMFYYSCCHSKGPESRKEEFEALLDAYREAHKEHAIQIALCEVDARIAATSGYGDMEDAALARKRSVIRPIDLFRRYLRTIRVITSDSPDTEIPLLADEDDESNAAGLRLP